MTVISKSVPVDDIVVACTFAGEGPPLVVLHGAIALGSTYMRPLDDWSDAFQVIQYDQRGSGETPLGDVGKVTFAGAVADLDGLRSALELDRMHVIGHSAGAHLAALYAAMHPDRVDALVLLNSGPPLVPELMQEFGQAMAARRRPEDDAERADIEASEAFRAGRPDALERHQLNTFLPFFRDPANARTVSLGFTEITAANVQAAPERMMGSLGALEPMRRYGEIACPTLVVHAELDPIPLAWSRALADTIPGAELAVVEGASHFAHHEDPGKLRDVVVPWLRENG